MLTVDGSGIHFKTPNFDANSGNGGVSAAEVASPEASKVITKLYWSYGEDEIEVQDISRHYADLNLHVETINYKNGESAMIEVEIPNSETLTFNVLIEANGYGVLHNIFNSTSIALEEQE